MRSPKACKFENAEALRKGLSAQPLTISSHPGLAVVAQCEAPRIHEDACEYIRLGVAPRAFAKPLRASLVGTLLARAPVTVRTTFEEEGEAVGEPIVKEYRMVFDVAFGKVQADGQVNMLQPLEGAPTKEEDAMARDFMINDDGSISPKAASHLVLGMAFVPRQESEDESTRTAAAA
jgi:hypothetical protein